MKNRSTTFELLRVLLTLFIPIYHWLLYNGIFYADNSANSIVSLTLFTGIPFSCLYAFLAMSSYFLLKKKYQWHPKKVYVFLALVFTLHIFRTILVNSLFQGYYMNYYIDTFFLKGAWWYVYPYILLMIFYPLLNRFIYNASIPLLYSVTGLFFLWFSINSINNDTKLLNDCILFLCIYFIMGCIHRKTDFSDFYKKYKRKILIIIYIVNVTLLTLISLYFKLPLDNITPEQADEILQIVHGRYNLFGLCSGIVIFTIFKDIDIPYKPIIHRLSKITLYVFLLHESVMSVFWYFEIKSAEYLAYLPMSEFFGWLIIYMICTILFSALMYILYSKIIEPLWMKLINFICKTKFSKKLETIYTKLDIEKKY